MLQIIGEGKWSDCTICSPHFTALVEVELFCFEPMLHRSIWFVTGCANVNTVREDRRGDYLEMVLLIRGLPQERESRRSTPPGVHSVRGNLYKEPEHEQHLRCMSVLLYPIYLPGNNLSFGT